MSPAERKAIVMKAYERLKVSLDKFLKPDGSQDAPAKTCGDIKHHHPDFESGKITRSFYGRRNSAPSFDITLYCQNLKIAP